MKMLYYILGTACATKETGNVYPQSPGMIDGYNYNASDSCWKLNHLVFPDFTPNLKAFRLDKKAKKTDVISTTSVYFGFLISSKFREILSKYNSPQHRFYTSYLKYNKEIENSYYLYHFIKDYSDIIDYQKTGFYLQDTFGNRKKIRINSANELITYHDSNKISILNEIVTDKYIFVENNMPEYDVFHISPNDPRTYISHRLKTALEEAKITGIEIIPTDVI